MNYRIVILTFADFLTLLVWGGKNYIESSPERPMNMLRRVMFRFVLYYTIGVVFTFPVCLFAAESVPQATIKSADIPNHHIFYRKDKRAPLTSIEIVFLGAGRTQEPPSKNGLAETASKLIRKFAKKHGYQDQWVSLGTKLDISIDTISLTISISALSENCGKSIEIVRDSHTQPPIF